MKTLSMLIAFFGLALLVSTCLPLAHADEWDKTTKMTFTEPVQVPGTVLPAGTYVFRLQDSSSDRHIVQIFNEDHTHLITTILAINDVRLEPTDKTVISYQERPSNQPVALRAWFYPGDNSGQEFVYPKSQAQLLSQLNHQEVPSTGTEEAYPLKQRSTETAQATTPPPPTQTPATTQPAPQPTNPQPANSPAATTNPAPTPANPPNRSSTAQQQPQQLPHTASPLPLIGLFGLAFISIAVVLRVARRA